MRTRAFIKFSPHIACWPQNWLMLGLQNICLSSKYIGNSSTVSVVQQNTVYNYLLYTGVGGGGGDFLKTTSNRTATSK